MQQRQKGTKLLSRALTRNLDRELVHRHWVLVTCGGTMGRTMFVHRNYENWVASEHVMRVVADESKCFPGYLYAFLNSPYGRTQIDQRIHGSVIQQIRDFEFESIVMPLPDDKGLLIHEKIVEAFDARADALESENDAIDLFDSAIKRGRELTEAEWGSEY